MVGVKAAGPGPLMVDGCTCTSPSMDLHVSLSPASPPAPVCAYQGGTTTWTGDPPTWDIKFQDYIFTSTHPSSPGNLEIKPDVFGEPPDQGGATLRNNEDIAGCYTYSLTFDGKPLDPKYIVVGTGEKFRFLHRLKFLLLRRLPQILEFWRHNENG
jgi:hypothetical protein